MDERAEFEAWVMQPPMEWDCDRYTENEAWPNDYRHYPAQCAWEGWQAATQRQQERIAELEAQVQALSLDAGRYTYLSRQMGTMCITDADENTGPVFKAAAADSHIDAAIAAGKGEG